MRLNPTENMAWLRKQTLLRGSPWPLDQAEIDESDEDQVGETVHLKRAQIRYWKVKELIKNGMSNQYETGEIHWWCGIWIQASNVILRQTIISSLLTRINSSSLLKFPTCHFTLRMFFISLALELNVPPSVF